MHLATTDRRRAMNSDNFFSQGLRRRDALVVAATTLGAGVVGCATRGSMASAPAEGVAASGSCVLTPEVTEGPYWIPNHLTRRNITGGQPGIPLLLHLKVERVRTCKLIAGADVELWHANAHGEYSGFSSSGGGGPGQATPTDAERFLRGHQKTAATGVATFQTIYPGWYQGRTPHIHVKVHVGGSVVHTGQLFFDDVTSDAVYRTARYKSHGQPDTTNGRDSIYAQAGGAKAKLHLTKHPANHGYVGALTLGVNG